MTRRLAFAPGRVNLIGEHTDYSGGLAMPVAIELGTTVSFAAAKSDLLLVSSHAFAGEARIPRHLEADATSIAGFEPAWAKYAAAVVALVSPEQGGRIEVSSNLPIGAGLSSSASFEVALALALGSHQQGRELAKLCQAAEELAFGGRTGLLDQLASVFGRRGQAMVIDFTSLELGYVTVPADIELAVVHSGLGRQVASTAYGERTRQCAAAEQVVGPLHLASLGSEEAIKDPLVRRRARHVISENLRVRAFAKALDEGDLVLAGRLLDESHASLATDYEVSAPALDDLVSYLRSRPGVYGARLTGAGFGGCALALSRPGALSAALQGRTHWFVTATDGARLLSTA